MWPFLRRIGGGGQDERPRGVRRIGVDGSEKGWHLVTC